jgi:predicted  nucleic acid-binding Zn-ribbon protein
MSGSPSKRVEQDDEIRLLRAELRAAREQIADLAARLERSTAEAARLRTELNDSWTHIREMRRSVSWRVTLPLRELRRRAARAVR